MAWRGNKLRRSLIDGIDLIILFQALKATFYLCTNLKLPFHLNCNIILYISQVLPLGDITMIGAVRVSPKNMAHLVRSKFRGKKWKWKCFTKVIFTTIYSRIFLKEPCGLFELLNIRWMNICQQHGWDLSAAALEDLWCDARQRSQRQCKDGRLTLWSRSLPYWYCRDRTACLEECLMHQ